MKFTIKYLLITLIVSSYVMTQGADTSTSTSTSTTSSTQKNYCELKKCAYCVPSATDATYKSCVQCYNLNTVLVNPASAQSACQGAGGDTTSCATSPVPNDVYKCSGSMVTPNCAVENPPNADGTNAGCFICDPSYKPVTTGNTPTCVLHNIAHCIAWSPNSATDNCIACEKDYEMKSDFTCVKSSSRILQSAGSDTSTSTSSNALISNCKYHYFDTTGLKCFACEKKYGVSTTGTTCSTSFTKGCRNGAAGTEAGTCAHCAIEAGWYATDAGTGSGTVYSQKCTFGASVLRFKMVMVVLAMSIMFVRY